MAHDVAQAVLTAMTILRYEERFGIEAELHHGAITAAEIRLIAEAVVALQADVTIARTNREQAERELLRLRGELAAERQQVAQLKERIAGFGAAAGGFKP